MIVDFHAHIYPEKISQKASEAISHFYEDSPVSHNGNSTELLKSGSKIGVSKYVVHSAATTENQVESINNFILSECALHKEFIGFGTVHPFYKNFGNELERIKNSGLMGIKLHPDFQKFQVDSEEMDDIYDVCASLGLIVLFHAGDLRYDFSGPHRILNVLNKHPSLKIVAAHFGGYTEWKESEEVLCGKNVYFDTSSTFWKLPVEKAMGMIKKHGLEKMLFGSDFPMWDHEDELSRFMKLPLTSSEKDLILGGNASVLLGL